MTRLNVLLRQSMRSMVLVVLLGAINLIPEVVELRDTDLLPYGGSDDARESGARLA